MKTRLLGAAVLLALLVLFVPMFFSSKPPAPGGDQSVSLAIPPAPDRDLQTKTMSLTPDAAVGTSSAAAPATQPTGAPATATPAAAGQLATVNIGSNRPRDVETDPQAGKKPTPTTVITGSGATSTEPVIPMQNKASASAPATKAAAGKAPKGAVAQETSTQAAPAAGHGNYRVNLSAYASAAGAASLQQRVQAMGFPVSSHVITQAGKSRTLVMAGPFETRTAAEAARLKISQSVPGVPARLQQDDGDASQAAAASPSKGAASAAVTPTAPAGKPHAGGFAVQLAAMSNQADANALRDKLRGAGFDGFVDTVQSGGKQLWRVRAGPQTQRADAERVRDQIKSKLNVAGNVVSVP